MEVLLLILGLISLGIIYIALYGFTFNRGGSSQPDHNQAVAHTKKTQKAMKKIMKLLDEKGQIQNDDVESLLNVSDSTATRYLDRLQEEEKIVQVGEQGRGVYYQKVESKDQKTEPRANQ